MLAPHLTVAENLFLGRLPKTRLGTRRLAARAAPQRSRSMARLGFRVDPAARLDTLSASRSARWSRSPRPCRATRASSSSTSRPRCSAAPSSKSCSTIIRRLRREGVELHLHLAPPAGGVRDLRPRHRAARRRSWSASKPIGEVDTAIADLDDGRPASSPTSTRAPAPVRARSSCSLRGLTAAGRAARYRPRRPRRRNPRHLRPGRLGPHRAAARPDRRRSPRSSRPIELRGRAVPRPPTRARRSARGIALLPEDRKTEGCFLPQSVAFNITISRLDEHPLAAPCSAAARARQVAGDLVRRLNIRTPRPRRARSIS